MKYLIANETEEWFVSRSPKIQFAKAEDALRMDKDQAIETMGILADMQRCSSMTRPEHYKLICRKDML